MIRIHIILIIHIIYIYMYQDIQYIRILVRQSSKYSKIDIQCYKSIFTYMKNLISI